MKKTLLVLALILCTCFAWSQSPFDKVSPDKKAEEAFQNIQTLKGEPSTSIRGAMLYMNSALGMECTGCHVKDGAWEKDDRNQKKTARKMIEMTREINKNSFNGRPQVTCFTCHQGHEQPTGVAMIPMPARPAGISRPPQGTQMPSAADLFAKYETALGGADKLAAVKSMVEKGSFVSPDGKTGAEEARAASDKFVSDVKFPDGTLTTGYNGKDGWAKVSAGEYHVTDELAPLLAREAELYPGSHLKAAAQGMRTVGIAKIGDRDAYVVAQGQQTRTPSGDVLFFDKESGLLVRQSYRVPTLFGPLPTQIDYEDYRAENGVQMPHRVKYSRPTASWTRTITSVQANAAIADAVFEGPAQK